MGRAGLINVRIVENVRVYRFRWFDHVMKEKLCRGIECNYDEEDRRKMGGRDRENEVRIGERNVVQRSSVW